MNRAEVESRVREILSTFLGSENTTATVRANVAAWDSLKHIQIVFAVEEAFGVQFSEEQIPRLDSLSRFVDQVLVQNAS